MSSNDKSGSCVETPTAPEWLSKLESRRELLKRSKLGHESGAGAPCGECKEKCPGLDLHFWRKVCRNCMCRKDQHLCTDDDTGWAQFEILGQIRAKPAYIKIKALANQQVQVEWVPPNASPDVITDYMDKLGAAQIPVTGSDAALKRKQQLEFQVPPHDLDAALCDNLSETEAQQLQLYVQKLREQCVGQGIVVRVGRLGHGQVEHIGSIGMQAVPSPPAAVRKLLTALGLPTQVDATLQELLSNPKLTHALSAQQAVNAQPKLLVAFSEPLSDCTTEFDEQPALRAETKLKLLGINRAQMQSLVTHGVIYDKLLGLLKEKNLNISRDARLGPIAEFRKEYVSNPQFRAEINTVCPPATQASSSSPLKCSPSTPFHSPLPTKNPVLARFGENRRQDTPMRRVKFGGVSTILYDCGMPAHIDYERDPVFAQIVQAEPLKQALQEARAGRTAASVIIAPTPAATGNLQQLPGLAPSIRAQLEHVGVDKQMLQSAVANAPYYNRLYQTLQEKGIRHDQCQLLEPLKQVNDWLLNDEQLLDDIDKLFADMRAASGAGDISYGNDLLPNSASHDSGFYSKPTTPGQAGEELNASLGKFTTIPGIEHMNMYPSCAGMPDQFQQLQLGDDKIPADSTGSLAAPVSTFNCRDCNLPIEFGEVAVKTERAGKEIAWHPGCFKCHTCRELLADLVYFFHHGQVYCGRDLAIKLKIPRCKACDELIFTKEYTAAEGATYHIKHFCCLQCDEPLAGQQYIPEEKSNMPLCLQCYDKFYAGTCKSCKLPIGPSDQGVAWADIHWHSNCFVCAGLECAKSLIGGRFCVKQNMPFCSPACVRSVIPA
ncbi:uncharacterized protein LOC6560187 [Drosophila grimshawi]|uniref:GH20485 n=1 Tax=Drosophila grimshawi TaxID=7222 RepID=B4J927_DROGR|nr:uncharacterized protein LOC6560187 [Drosophila grimshawi]EDW01376.1 GH20485 [Drosophila grimshawi]